MITMQKALVDMAVFLRGLSRLLTFAWQGTSALE